MDPAEEAEDVNSILPTIAALLAAVVAYNTAKDTAKTPLAAMEAALDVTAKLEGVLAKIATKMAMSLFKGTTSRKKKEAVLAVLDKAVDAAVADGLVIASQSVRALAMNIREMPEVEAPTSKRVDPPVSTAPKPSTRDKSETKAKDVVPGSSDDPKYIAERITRTIRDSTQYNVGSYANEELGGDDDGQFFMKTWHSKSDQRVRATHAFLGSPKYEFHTVKMGEKFVSISGATLRYPHDVEAPIGETARCRCWMTVR